MTEKKSTTSAKAAKASEKEEVGEKDTRRVDTPMPNLDVAPAAASPANGGSPTPDPVAE